MVKNVIKVFARLKRETPSKKNKEESYVITKSKSGCEDLIVHRCNKDVIKNSYYKFRYQKIFDQESSQNDIFDQVAKPVVNSVIHGFNGTIFAYGQTGSGKTYSITGCPKVYENRGIIPRSIQYIFDYLNQNPDLYTVHLSYLEIYNEIGYDLLNPKQIASKLEEYPRVLLLEDAKGEAHLRNLSIHPVCTEKEAMRLLFLGDTNRTIAETPMNEYSSRSHCIFTIHLSSRQKNNGRNIKSKLHIVDLAGSERIHKSNITGTLLHEAKNINLSLHYLEQVILALSSSKRGHIPYRNSMLTSLLKDSLCGNSLTTMLATLAVTKKNIEETISTCRFSMRVSLVTIDPTINEEDLDSQHEINILYTEINELKSKLLKYENNSLNSTITGIEEEKPVQERKEYCKKVTDDYLRFKTEPTGLTMLEMKFCMEIMRDLYLSHQKENAIDEIQDLKTTLKQKEDEICTLKSLLDLQVNKNEVSRDTPKILNAETVTNLKTPRWKYEKDIEEYNMKLEEKCQEAKTRVEIIEQCKKNILNIRARLQNCSDIARQSLNDELYHQQDIYRKTILALRELEKETHHLKLGLLQVELKIKKNSEQFPECGVNTNEPKSQRDFLSSQFELQDYSNIFKNYERAERDYGNTDRRSERDRPEVSGSFLQTLINQDDQFSQKHFGFTNPEFSPYFESGVLDIGGREVLTPPCHDSPNFQHLADDAPIGLEDGRLSDFSSTLIYRNKTNSNIPSSIDVEINNLETSKLEEFSLFKPSDSAEFKEFMKSIPLTGDQEVDDEIFNFYRSKFVDKKLTCKIY